MALSDSEHMAEKRPESRVVARSGVRGKEGWVKPDLMNGRATANHATEESKMR